MIKIISHRGNLNGPQPKFENNIEQVEKCLNLGIEVEIDLWFVDDNYWLGHDNPEFKVSLIWLMDRQDLLWIHCKNINALCSLQTKAPNLNFFWHEQDAYTLTSKGWLWCYPNKQVPAPTLIKGIRAVSVMPEVNQTDFKNFSAICTDIPLKFLT